MSDQNRFPLDVTSPGPTQKLGPTVGDIGQSEVQKSVPVTAREDQPQRLHIQAYHCREGGQLDYGSLPYDEAFAKVRELVDGGKHGGCRCRPGWTIRSCPKKQHDCADFNLDKFNYEDIYAE